VLRIGSDSAVAPGVREALLAEDLRLVEAGDVASALEVARRERPALVLLDLDLPRAKLLEACRALRGADPRLREVPLLVVDGDAPAGREVSEVFEAGATDYLARPLKVTLLRARVRGWLLRARAG
jgi:putative two-component system response regulator